MVECMSVSTPNTETHISSQSSPEPQPINIWTFNWSIKGRYPRPEPVALLNKAIRVTSLNSISMQFAVCKHEDYTMLILKNQFLSISSHNKRKTVQSNHLTNATIHTIQRNYSTSINMINIPAQVHPLLSLSIIYWESIQLAVRKPRFVTAAKCKT